MKTERRLPAGRAVVLAAAAAAAVAAVTAALLVAGASGALDWLPKGGRVLLIEVLDACADCDGLSELGAAGRTRDEWGAYFDARGALEQLSGAQRRTLLAYLEANLPFPGLTPEGLASGPYAQPYEGPVLTMEACGVCHGVGLALFSERDEAGWLDFVLSPVSGHAEYVVLLPFSEANWRTLAAYLGLNMPLDPAAVPEPYRDTRLPDG
jgi:hypothetical protein